MGFLNPAIRTPTMDRLAREGMHFERMYPTNSICMPSRSSMITGRSQRGHQVFNHDVNMSEAFSGSRGRPERGGLRDLSDWEGAFQDG